MMNSSTKAKIYIIVSGLVIASCGRKDDSISYKSFDYYSMHGIEAVKESYSNQPYVRVTQLRDSLTSAINGLALEIFRPGCDVEKQNWIKKNDSWYCEQIKINREYKHCSGCDEPALNGTEKFIYATHDSLLVYTNESTIPLSSSGILRNNPKIGSLEIKLKGISYTYDMCKKGTFYGATPSRKVYQDSIEFWKKNYGYTETTYQTTGDTLFIKSIHHSRDDESATLRMIKMNGVSKFFIGNISENNCNESVKTLNIYSFENYHGSNSIPLDFMQLSFNLKNYLKGVLSKP